MPDLEDLIGSFRRSSYREQVLEQAFLAELLTAGWRLDYPPLEIDRPFVDAYGYDLIITCGSVVRHVQLKAIKAAPTVHVGLAEKPAGCIVNIRPSTAEGGRHLDLQYRYYGHEPIGHIGPMSIDGLKKAKKAHHVDVGGGQFEKVPREHHVIVPNGKFTKPAAIDDLVPLLLGRR